MNDLNLYYWDENQGRLLIIGDCELDGDVNIFDLARLANNYRKSGMTWLEGDFTGDGLVNIYDFAHLANSYGRDSGDWAELTTGGSPIPEPACLVLLVAGLLGLAQSHRPRRLRST